jgi:hypothetical protein
VTPRHIANLQLEAYNNHDLDTYCQLFTDDAELIDLPSSNTFASGIEQIRAIYQQRFNIETLVCKVHSRNDIGNFAIDHETVYGLPEGPVDIVAMYEVIEGKIQRVYFIREPYSN